MKSQSQTVLGRIPENGFLRLSQLVPHIIPVSKPTWWRWVREGKAPKPTRLGSRTTAWSCSSIRKFLADQSPEEYTPIPNFNGKEGLKKKRKSLDSVSPSIPESV